MGIYIKYVNSKKNFLYEEIVDDALLDSTSTNINLKLSDIFNTDYIKKKLRELIFKTIPSFKNATIEVLELLGIIISSYCKRLIRNFKKSISDIRTGINLIFEKIHFFLNNNIQKISQIYALKNDFDLDIKDINNKLNEFPNFEIDMNDIKKINEFCKLTETQIFTLEQEDNYICLPFDDIKKFKVIKVANYYDEYFGITDQESNDILDILIEYKEKGTRSFKRKIGDTQEILCEIIEDNDYDNWNGQFDQYQNKIKIKEKPYLMEMYLYFSHEFIHYKDYTLNKSKFTNVDFSYILEKLTTLKKDSVISYDKMKNLIIEVLDSSNKEIDESYARYIISLLQKKKYIDYYNDDFTKIKINFIPTFYKSSDKINYFRNPIELNTHLNDVVNEILLEFNEIEDNQDISNDEKEKQKKEYFVGIVEDKVDHIYQEIIKQNQIKDEKKKKDLKSDLLKYYTKKVYEKIKINKSNKIVNKEKFNKIESYYE